MASDPPVHGKNRERGGRRAARVVGAVTVTVALPEPVIEVGETAHVVPGSVELTLQVSATVPVKTVTGVMVAVEVPTLPVAPTASDSVAGETVSWKSGSTM